MFLKRFLSGVFPAPTRNLVFLVPLCLTLPTNAFKVPGVRFDTPQIIKDGQKGAEKLREETEKVAPPAVKEAIKVLPNPVSTAAAVTTVVVATPSAAAAIVVGAVTGDVSALKYITPLATPEGQQRFLTDLEREGRKGLGNLEREGRKGLANIERENRKGLGNIETNLRKGSGDVGRELKATQGHVEGAAVATYQFTVRQITSTGESLSAAEKRVREGKFIDAMWHMATDPVQFGSKNAAAAATESAVLATVMSVAASTYGGPAGAAAYAAWLAYYQSGGDVNVALRTGLVAAIKSYAVPAAGAEAASVSEAFKQAAVAGVMSGLAVAAAGGSAADIQQTMLATAGSMLVKDGFQALAIDPATSNIVSTAKTIYCVKAIAERADDKSCPKPMDYLTDGQGRFAMLDGSGNVKYVDLKTEVPGGEWLFLSKKEALEKGAGAVGIDLTKLPVTDINQFKAKMVESAKVKGASVLGLLGDRVALEFEPMRKVPQLNTFTAPSIVVTMTGLPDLETVTSKSAKEIANLAARQVPIETVQCSKGGPSTSSATTTFWIERGKPGDTLQCVVARQDNGKPTPDWYARNDPMSCDDRLVSVTKALISQGSVCFGR
jgi:hypothetical protein